MEVALLNFVLKRIETLDYYLFDLGIVVFVFAFYKFIYERDRKDNEDRVEKLDKKIEEKIKYIDRDLKNHVKEQTEASKEIIKSISDLKEGISNINVILAKKHLTKADLYNEDWEEVTIRMEETISSAFNTLYDQCISGSDESPEDIKQKFVIFVGFKRRESFDVWERVAIQRRILNVIEEVDKIIAPRIWEHCDDILSTYINNELTENEKTSIIQSKVSKYKELTLSEWKMSFIEKINFKS